MGMIIFDMDAVLQYWPTASEQHKPTSIRLKTGELGFWAPCIRQLNDDWRPFLTVWPESARPASGPQYLPSSIGSIVFDDEHPQIPNELVILFGGDWLLRGLAVRMRDITSTRLGYLNISSDILTGFRQGEWQEFFDSPNIQCYWRYVVLN